MRGVHANEVILPKPKSAPSVIRLCESRYLTSARRIAQAPADSGAPLIARRHHSVGLSARH